MYMYIHIYIYMYHSQSIYWAGIAPYIHFWKYAKFASLWFLGPQTPNGKCSGFHKGYKGLIPTEGKYHSSCPYVCKHIRRPRPTQGGARQGREVVDTTTDRQKDYDLFSGAWQSWKNSKNILVSKGFQKARLAFFLLLWILPDSCAIRITALQVGHSCRR